MPNHTVQPGEHLAFIADQAGFRDIATVWEDGRNAELRALRDNPGVLAPDDVLFVPDKEQKQEDRPTGANHVFRVKGGKLWLRLALLDFDDVALANAKVILEVDGAKIELVTDAGGRIDQQVPRRARTGRLRIPDLGLELALDIGMLDPVDTDAGWRARLVNLGYFHGDADDPGADNERWDWALQEFQCDHALDVTGEPDGATRAKLLELCGS